MKQYYVTNEIAITAETYTYLDVASDSYKMAAGRKDDDSDCIILFFETNADPAYIGWAEVESGNIEIYEGALSASGWQDFEINAEDVVEAAEKMIAGIKEYDALENKGIICTYGTSNIIGDYKVWFKTTDEAYVCPSIDNATRDDGYIMYTAEIITDMGQKGRAYWTFTQFDDDGHEIDSDNHNYMIADSIEIN